jgi:hypothetical protein
VTEVKNILLAAICDRETESEGLKRENLCVDNRLLIRVIMRGMLLSPMLLLTLLFFFFTVFCPSQGHHTLLRFPSVIFLGCHVDKNDKVIT